MSQIKTTTIANSQGSQITLTSVEYDEIPRMWSPDSRPTAHKNRQGKMAQNQQEPSGRKCLKYFFELLKPEEKPATNPSTVQDEMNTLQIKSRMVFWLIGSEENKELKSPYGRRFLKDFLNVVLDCGALLICQGTDDFFKRIRTHCQDLKLTSAKNEINVLICENKGKSNYEPKIETTHQLSNGEEDCFQLVLLFEGGCVNYSSVHPYIPSKAQMILFYAKDERKNDQAPQTSICCFGLENKYAEESFSVGKFIFEAFQNNEAQNNERKDQDLIMLSIYLNQTENVKQLDFEKYASDERPKEKWLKNAVRLYHPNCLNVMWRKGNNWMQFITEDDVLCHLEKVSWCKKLCPDKKGEEKLTLCKVKAEINRRIKEILGKNCKKGVETLTLAEVLFVDAILENKLEASISYWTFVKHPVTAALIASGLFKTMKQADNRTTLKENINTYNKLAMEVVNSSYVNNRSYTFKLLEETVEEWGDASCVQIALATDNKAFFAEHPLVDMQERLWRGQPLAAEFSI